MYQIVLTSEFIRDLKDSTGPGGPDAAAPPSHSIAAPEATVIEFPRARRSLAVLGALVLGAAHRLLGVH